MKDIIAKAYAEQHEPLTVEEWAQRMRVILAHLIRAEEELTDCRRDVHLMLTRWIVNPTMADATDALEAGRS